MKTNPESQRIATWTILMAHDLPKLWAPGMVDIALNLAPGATTLDEVLCPAVVDAIRTRFAKFDFYAGCPWTVATLRSGVHNRKPLLGFFVERSYSTILRTLKIGSISISDGEEMRAVIMEALQVFVPSYVPGRTQDGEYQEWGFEAYLTTRGVNKATNSARDLLFHHGDISMDAPMGEHRTVGDCLETLAPGAVIQHAGVCENDFKPEAILEVMFAASEEVLQTPTDVALYMHYMSGEATLKDVAARLGIPVVTAQYRIKHLVADIFARARQLFAESHGLGVEEAQTFVLGYAWGPDNGVLSAVPTETDAGLRIALADLLPPHCD